MVEIFGDPRRKTLNSSFSGFFRLFNFLAYRKNQTTFKAKDFLKACQPLLNNNDNKKRDMINRFLTILIINKKITGRETSYIELLVQQKIHAITWHAVTEGWTLIGRKLNQINKHGRGGA